MAKKPDSSIRSKIIAAPPITARKKRAVPDNAKLHLDAFTAAYIECAIWIGLPECYQVDKVWPACIPAIMKDCALFQREHYALLQKAYVISDYDYDASDAGYDFWMSRQGNGVDFRDRSLGKVGDKLAAAAASYGPLSVLPGEGKQRRYIFIA
jgi:hypothetical protein